MDAALVVDLADRFDELGLRFEGPLDLAELPEQQTVSATLRHEAGSARYRVGHAPSLTMSSLAWAKNDYASTQQLLLLGPRITERSAERLRLLGINYLDRTGNAFITFAGVHIDIRGRRPESNATNASDTPRATRGGVNLFSPKRSQVIFAILMWPELLSQPLRDLAFVAGVSLGQAQETVELLEQYGFLSDTRTFVASRRHTLIDQWAAAYPLGPGSLAKAGRFSGDFDSGLASLGENHYVSGEAAAPEILHPETMTLYSDSFPTELIRTRRWRRDDDHPNILLRHRFWNRPEPRSLGMMVAPWLLVYADLLASGEGRQREAAERLRAAHD